MSFYVHKGRVAIRVGRYWVCFEPSNVTNGKRHASAKRALAAPPVAGGKP